MAADSSNRTETGSVSHTSANPGAESFSCFSSTSNTTSVMPAEIGRGKRAREEEKEEEGGHMTEAKETRIEDGGKRLDTANLHRCESTYPQTQTQG